MRDKHVIMDDAGGGNFGGGGGGDYGGGGGDYGGSVGAVDYGGGDQAGVEDYGGGAQDYGPHDSDHHHEADFHHQDSGEHHHVEHEESHHNEGQSSHFWEDQIQYYVSVGEEAGYTGAEGGGVDFKATRLKSGKNAAGSGGNRNAERPAYGRPIKRRTPDFKGCCEVS